MIGATNPYEAHHICLSSRSGRKKVLIIRDDKNEMHRKVHYHPSNLMDYVDLKLLFNFLNWVEYDESEAPPSLVLAVKLGIRALILPINRNRLIPRIEV